MLRKIETIFNVAVSSFRNGRYCFILFVFIYLNKRAKLEEVQAYVQYYIINIILQIRNKVFIEMFYHKNAL